MGIPTITPAALRLAAQELNGVFDAQQTDAILGALSAVTDAPVEATTVKAGTIRRQAAVANATDAATVIVQLNLLLSRLRAAGILSN